MAEAAEHIEGWQSTMIRPIRPSAIHRAISGAGRLGALGTVVAEHWEACLKWLVIEGAELFIQMFFAYTHKFSAVMKVALGYTWLDSLWIHCLICVLLEQVSWTKSAEEIHSTALTSVSAPWSRAFKASMFVRGRLSKASDFAWFRSRVVYWTIGNSV